MITKECPIVCAVAIVLMMACVVLGALPGMAAVTERVSVSSTGEEGNSGSEYPAVSADGRFVAFQSFASNLVAGDTNGTTDVFVRDRLTNSVELVSVSSGGAQGDNESRCSDISPDGRYVAFYSPATNLVSDDTNGVWDAFVHDRSTGVTERVSVSSSGEQSNDDSYLPKISADGRHVAFESWSTNLAANDANGTNDIFVRDMTDGLTWRISNNAVGEAANSWSNRPNISDDASCVVFTSLASDIVPNDTAGQLDIFAYDMSTGNVKRVSTNITGDEANLTSQNASVSADGRYVAFASWASNLVGGDTNSAFDIFVFDRLAEVTERISVSSGGAQGDGHCYETAISADGRYVAFKSDSTNLVAGDTNGKWDVFVRDRLTGITERMSVSTAGAQANDDSQDVAISGDGRCVAFYSTASNLVSGDFNGNMDIFLRDRLGSGYTQPENVSISPSGGTLGAAPATLVSTYRDANGFADIKRCYLLINDSLGQSNAALFYYDRAANRLYLKNDANTSWGTGYAPGANVTLENSQCYLYVKDTIVTSSGNNLAVKWRVAFKAPFSSKLLKGYMYVQDSGGLIDGWDQMGVYHNVKPEVVGIDPCKGQIPIDNWTTLTSYYRDQNGYEDLRKCYLLVNDALVQKYAMFLWYDRVSNKVYLRNDENTSWGTGCTPGVDLVLENSQCIVEVKGTSVSGSGNNLAITWSFALKSAEMGSRNLYSWMYAADSKTEISGYKKVGTHFDPLPPECLLLLPHSGDVDTGYEQSFATVYSDPNGFADIYKIYIQLSVTSSQANAVLLMWDAKQNKVFLKNDAGTSWGTGYAPGAAVILENSQCKLNLASMGPPYGVTPEQLEVFWPIELKASQAGKLLCARMFVQDNALLNSGWKVKGYVRAK